MTKKSHNHPQRLLTEILVALCLTLSAASGSVLFTNLYSFTGASDGCFPWGPLVQGSDGNLYGTASYGGARNSINGYGTVFKMTLAGDFTQLYAFHYNGDGASPALGGVVEGPDGYFYGTTLSDGDYGNGTIFVVTPDGFEFPIYSFDPNIGDGSGPTAGLALGGDGSFYGTTLSGGPGDFVNVVRIDVNWNYTLLFSFNGINGRERN